jgi:hypothetical protein
MTVILKHFFVGLLIVLLPLIGSAAYAQSSDAKAEHMVGDKDGVWIYMSDNRLIYCWWPQNPGRTERTASCRIMDAFRVNMMR